MAKQPQDDLFEGGSMSFGEHLEELRICLFRSVFGIVIGCAIGLYAADHVVRFFQGPLERALTEHYLGRALVEVAEDFNGKAPYEYQQTIIEGRLVPEKMNIEPAQLASALSIMSPALLGDTRLSPNAFIPEDFAEASKEEEGQEAEGKHIEFARLLVNQEKKATESPARRIWQMLSDEQQTKVREIAAGKSKQPRRELVSILNDLLAKPELHNSKEFAGLTGADKAAVAQLRERVKEKPDDESTRRLNKLLLAGTFPDHFRTPRVNLVTFYNWKPVKVRFQVLTAQEAFMIYLKAALLTGVVLASPWVFYQIWNFVAAGLYPHEKSQVFLYLPISLILFLAGASLAFGFVFEPVLSFLFQFNQGLNAEFDPRVGEWLSFVLILPLGFGVSFQLPLVMLFINRLGLVTVELFMQQWRMAILIIFVVAMVLTPADPISMLLMAVPLCGLYVMGIAMCLWMPRSRNPFDQAYEPSA